MFFSYALITPSASILYIEESKLSADVKAHLGDAVEIKPYDTIFKDIEGLSNETSKSQTETPNSPAPKFLLSTKASWIISQCLGGEDKAEEIRSPIGDAKAVKNDVEIQGMRECHIRDGAALIEYFAWLEDQLVNKQEKVNEVQGADKLEAIRS